jgi:pyridoxal phosphate enzyme (YggS family)
VSGIAARLAEVRARIAAACARAGRDPAGVRLVGASKLQPVESLREAYAAGLRRFGENRVQEGAAKAPELPADVEWHLLGPLQSNKVKRALELFHCFHAVDRPKIARALDAEAAARGLRPRALLEVNLGGEASKHGFDPATLADEAAPLAELAHLEIVGLMAIPPPGPDPEASRADFRRLRELAAELGARPEWRGRLAELSMGMSDDFEVAVEEGATYVRVGTRLFGPRSAAGS